MRDFQVLRRRREFMAKTVVAVVADELDVDVDDAVAVVEEEEEEEEEEED
jgi:hypothetical protein